MGAKKFQRPVERKTVLHIGRKCPKGYVEEPGAIHLGNGQWAMRITPVESKKKESPDAR